MVDMATAFGVFANSGYRINLHPILKVTDKTGKVLEEYKPLPSPIFGQKVLPDGVAFIISDILADNGARLAEFGDNSELKIKDKPVSVKTRYYNDFRDNWTIGYTPSFLVAAWVGNDDNSQMSGLVSGITGAAPIWNDIMSNILKGRAPQPMSRPPGIIQKAVCSDTGLPTTVAGATCSTDLNTYLKVPKTPMDKLLPAIRRLIKLLRIYRQSQTDNLETKTETVYTDPTGDRFCMTCPHPSLISPTPTPAP